MMKALPDVRSHSSKTTEKITEQIANKVDSPRFDDE
jgi:hypothetical protein